MYWYVSGKQWVNDIVDKNLSLTPLYHVYSWQFMECIEIISYRVFDDAGKGIHLYNIY